MLKVGDFTVDDLDIVDFFTQKGEIIDKKDCLPEINILLVKKITKRYWQVVVDV